MPTVSLRRADVWADLRYALDELIRPPLDIHSRLTDAANLGAQPEKEFFDRLFLISELSHAYSGARMRANTRNAHEAIEKGLKAILIDTGLSGSCIRARRHQLHQLLADVQQHDPRAFDELERCFRSTIQHLKSVTGFQHNTDIVKYFRRHGKAEVFVANRYASIEDGHNTAGGMIGVVYMEIIRALASLMLGLTPKDINARVEEAAKKAVVAESADAALGAFKKAVSANSEHYPAWDAAEWLNRGLVRPRLEDIKNLDNKVLRFAVRRCAREHKGKDWGIWFWAERLRRKYVGARRRARATRIVLGETR